MSNPITRTALIKLVRPFVGAKLNRRRDPNSKHGAYLPLTQSITVVRAGVEHIHADVRGVSGEGIDIQSPFGDSTIVPWDAVRSVVIADLDAMGNRSGERIFVPMGAPVGEVA